MGNLDYKELLEETPNFIYFHDLEGRFLEVNETFKTLLGFEKSNVIGQGVSDFIHPKYRQEFAERYLPEILSKGTAKGLMLVRDREGKTHLLEYHNRLVVKDGSPIGVHGMAKDVSARKRLEKEIAEREALYRALFEHAADAIFLMEGELFVACNPRTLEMFGCEKKDIIKKPPYLFSPKNQPDGRLSREKALEKIHAALEGIPQRFEWVHTRLDGTPFDTIVSLFRIELQKRQLIVATVHDISPQKKVMRALEESERNYRELVENTNVIICRFTPDGTYTFMNRFGEEFFGYSREELVGKKSAIGTIIPETGGGSERFKAMFRDICIHPERYYENETKNTTRDGREVYIAWRNQPIKDNNGEVREILSIGVDMTRIRELESELLQAKKLEAVGTLAGGIAHDFNNILGGIMGYVSLLKQQHAPEDEHYGILERLEEAGTRASDLVKQLLAFSRRGKYESRDVDVNETIQSVLEILKHTALKKIEFNLELESALPVIVGDPSQIEQVVMNTCLNGIQAMPEGGLLKIGTSHKAAEEVPESLIGTDKATSYIEISISDTGSGMDEYTREHIFEPFFTTKSVGEGTGLGLSTVYGIVKNHDGGITVESKKEQGTTFRIYFPATDRKVKKEKIKTARGNPRMGKGKILVADDEEVFREMLKDVLEYLGYEVLLAKDGRDGLEVFKAYQDIIDLVILDMNMPVMDGKEMFRELKKLSPDIKALLATGFTLDGQVQELMDEGVMGFIQKPFRIEEISTAINALMEIDS